MRLHVTPDHAPSESLAGLQVILVTQGNWLDPHRTTRILHNAGATVHLVHDEAQALRLAVWIGAHGLVIRDSAGHVEAIDPGFAAFPDVRHLVLMRGRRRRPWMLRPGVTAVDADFLHASIFVHAVAVAAGRASTGVPHDGQPERRAHMVAWMGRVGVAGLSSVVLAGCAIPSAMPVTAPQPQRARITATARVTIPGLRYEEREVAVGELAGRFIDDATGLPVAQGGAAWLTERPDSTAADDWGRFALGALAPGRYTLVSYAPGFEPRIDRVEVAASGAAVEIRLKRATLGQRLAPLPAKGSAMPRVVAAGGAGAN